MTKANASAKMPDGEKIADDIISRYWDGTNAGGNFVADISVELGEFINQLYFEINRLKVRNKSLRKKHQDLQYKLKVYENFSASLPFSINDFNKG